MISQVRGCALAVALLPTICVSCKGSGAAPSDVQDAAESPQALAVPAPLANTTASAQTAGTSPDAGPPATPLRADQPIHDEPSEKVVIGLAYTMTMRPLDPILPAKAPEVSAAGLEAARKKTVSTMTVELGAQRMRMTLGQGFLLPEDTELRARADRTGHIVLLPSESAYRVVAPSALRALLGENRLDVMPMTTADISQAGEGTRRFSPAGDHEARVLKTRLVRIEARGAHADLELTRIIDAPDSGNLVCRFVLELMGASPTPAACAADEIPVHIELHWPKRGGLIFELDAAPHRAELAPSALATPPSGSVFLTTPIPPRDSGVFLSSSDLAQIHSAAVDVAKPAAATPEGLILVNTTDEMRVASLDGVMVAWLAPGARITLNGLLHGRYQAELRPFLRDGSDPVDTVTVPGILSAR